VTPSISVVVPSYNEEARIGRCLASLADQTLSRDEYEVIVVDGNSAARKFTSTPARPRAWSRSPAKTQPG
jgi:cellulose synthase/poly-beta-1,6-N-acetylglucosamine synthase-like glycosyltransferase